jgi:hypothetical protein
MPCLKGKRHKWAKRIYKLVGLDGKEMKGPVFMATTCEHCHIRAVENGRTGKIEAPHKFLFGVR